jgi:hypothetical protein
LLRRLEQKYARTKEYDYDFKRSKKRVNIKFGNNNSESHDVFSYDILVKLMNKNKNKEILFSENFIELDTGVDMILSYHTLVEHGIFDLINKKENIFYESPIEISPEEMEEEEVMDILAPLSVNEG